MDAQGTPSNTCPLLGSDITTRFTQSTRERLFMNFGAPAQCNGTVTSWTYCYYNVNSDDDCDEGSDDSVSYRSVFLVYRKTGTSNQYAPVLETTKLVTLSPSCSIGRRQLPCQEVVLSPSEQFSVQQNDVIAACLPSTGSVRVVGEQSAGPSMGVYQYNDNGFARCSDSQLPTVVADTQSNTFTLNGGRFRLHLSAEISSE